MDDQGNRSYHKNPGMNATIAQLRQHFKDCNYQKKLVLKPGREVRSPSIKECSRVLVTDEQVTLHRKFKVSPVFKTVMVFRPTKVASKSARASCS